jgi:NAD(P)H-hydrate epimerase
MKVIDAKALRSLEEKAIEDGYSSKDFMLKAGKNISSEILKILNTKKNLKKIFILLGKGNNAGDSIVVAKHLKEQNIDFTIYQLFEEKEYSSLLKEMLNENQNLKKNTFFLRDLKDLKIDKNTLIIDAIFGSGFKGKIKNFLFDLINKVNNSNAYVLSIDIPSGVDGNTGQVETIAIKSDLTISLGLLKTGFFINDGPKYINKLINVDFGLDKRYIDKVDEKFNFFMDYNLKKLLPKIDLKRDKYKAGFVVALAGSLGMYGAAKLSSKAALKTGSGIVKLITEKEIDNAFYELVNLVIDYSKTDEIINHINKADSCFIGPGLSRDKKIFKLLKKIIPKINTKTVLDADALYFLSKNLDVKLPKDTILTPHKKEMQRLLNADAEGESLIEKTLDFANKKNVIIVLKGYPTIIFKPNEKPLIIMDSTPALATAGTGDVLTGMIASFVAQKLELYDASVLAVNLHNIAAKLAEKDLSSYSLMASDVIDYIPKAFLQIINS